MQLKTLWTLLVFVPAMSADMIMCNGGAASVPVLDLSSVSEAVGDYTLDCTGGTPVLPPNPIPVIDVNVVMNVPVLNTSGWMLTDGVTGKLDGSKEIEFLGVPFNPPGTGNVVLQVENIFVDPSAEPPGFHFTEDAEIFSDISFGISNPKQVVAVNAVPEPSTLLLAGTCFLGILTRSIWRRSYRRNS
jgi:hypothetical protein